MLYKKSNNIEIKKINKNTIYKYILEKEKISKHDIAIGLDMSMPTVLQNIKELLNQNLIKEVGEFQSSGGRKAKAISIISDARLSIGIDITKNHVSLVLVDLTGKVIKHIRLKNTFSYDENYFLWFNKSINDFTEGIDRNKILGAGVSIPGIIDKSATDIANSYVLGFGKVPFTDFTKYIPFECIFINDANAAGFAEARYLENNSLYLSLSNSVGGAIIFAKQLYNGDNIRSGEFGHMRIVPNGIKCYCGKIGCLDSYCKANLLSDLTNGKLGDFFKELEEGNKDFLKIWENYLYYLAIAVNNLRMAFDCDVIIGGYVGGYFENYIDDFRKRVAELNTFETNGNYVKVCKHHFEAAALGAALQHIYAFIDKI